MGLDFDARLDRIFILTFRSNIEGVAGKMGAGIVMSVQPRFAIAFWLISETRIPVIIDIVKVLLTMGILNSECFEYSWSKRMGC